MQGLLVIPSPSGGGLGWGRLFVVRKVADSSDFTLTPTLSLKGEGQSKGPVSGFFQVDKTNGNTYRAK